MAGSQRPHLLMCSLFPKYPSPSPMTLLLVPSERELRRQRAPIAGGGGVREAAPPRRPGPGQEQAGW